MTAVSDIPLPGSPQRRTSIQRWRRRSRVIAALRIALPSLIGLILAGLAASVAYNTLSSQKAPPGAASDPIRLVNPHFIGRDTRGRPFVLSSATATRDPQD